MADKIDTEQQEKTDKADNRAMWIASIAIVVLIVGMMGAKVMFGTSTPMTDGEISSQSRTGAQ
jgi:hypothetical protein